MTIQCEILTAYCSFNVVILENLERFVIKEEKRETAFEVNALIYWSKIHEISRYKYA